MRNFVYGIAAALMILAPCCSKSNVNKAKNTNPGDTTKKVVPASVYFTNATATHSYIINNYLTQASFMPMLKWQALAMHHICLI
jgi:hypothetical protein